MGDKQEEFERVTLATLAEMNVKLDNLVEHRVDHGTRIKWLERVVYACTPLLILATGYQVTPIGG